MPVPARPHWNARRACWWSSIGPPGKDGKPREVFFRAPIGPVPAPGPGDERAAYRWMEAYLAEAAAAAERLVKAGPERPTFAALAESFIAGLEQISRESGRNADLANYRNRRLHLQWAASVLGDRPAEDLNDEDAKELVRRLRAAELSARYTRSIVTSCQVLLAWASRPGRDRGRLIPSNPWAGIQKPKVPAVRGRYVDDEQIGQFFVWAAGRARYQHRNLKHFDRVFLRYWLFTLATGCRPGEAIRLRWDQVDRRAGLAILDEHKTAGSTGRVRSIPLTPAAIRILDRVRANPRRHAVYCFPCAAGKRLGRGVGDEVRLRGNPWSSTQAAARALLRLRKRAIVAGCELAPDGPGRLTAYSSRYRSVTNLLRVGLSEALVARIHGHSPQMVRDVYEQLRDEELAVIRAEAERTARV